MTPDDKIKTVKLLAAYGEIYNKNLSEYTYEIYLEALKETSFEEIEKNGKKHLKISRFFPTPIDLSDYRPTEVVL